MKYSTRLRCSDKIEISDLNYLTYCWPESEDDDDEGDDEDEQDDREEEKDEEKGEEDKEDGGQRGDVEGSEDEWLTEDADEKLKQEGSLDNVANKSSKKK
jgi:hypothetical protein